MKALTLLPLFVGIVLSGCSADKSDETRNVATPPAKSQIPGGASAVPPQAQKALGDGK